MTACCRHRVQHYPSGPFEVHASDCPVSPRAKVRRIQEAAPTRNEAVVERANVSDRSTVFRHSPRPVVTRGVHQPCPEHGEAHDRLACPSNPWSNA